MKINVSVLLLLTVAGTSPQKPVNTDYAYSNKKVTFPDYVKKNGITNEAVVGFVNESYSLIFK